MKFFILVGGSSRTTGDLIKPKKSLKKTWKKGGKGAQDMPKIHETSEPNREPGNRVRLTGNRCEPEPGLFKDQGPKYIPLYPFFTKKLIFNEFPPSKNRFFPKIPRSAITRNPGIKDFHQKMNFHRFSTLKNRFLPKILGFSITRNPGIKDFHPKTNFHRFSTAKKKVFSQNPGIFDHAQPWN